MITTKGKNLSLGGYVLSRNTKVWRMSLVIVEYVGFSSCEVVLLFYLVCLFFVDFQ